MPNLLFWYDFASPYSYLSAMRIEKLCLDRGIKLVWRPFLLSPIFKKQGLETSPFKLNRAKEAYLWKDVARQCWQLGLPFEKPKAFPQNSLHAARVAYVGKNESWIGPFTRAVFHAHFALGQDISNKELLSALLDELGVGGEATMKEAESAAVKIGVRADVAEAEAQGVFGAPSFVTSSGEVFWGNDRLDDALDASFGRIA
ncbi:2-hydroxychromene-2-carboxylate isomerase [Rhodobacteraceae bacterium RKSG542]|uniref:2-hydroxychromene-2-carboxylate isomerase n=1 Tax=Pseudovibrio flavus TaxID=2529854 RepID=UPI0012BD7187|nr:2-hydroxychromene-2-carboxylate isomerase [Pseudovibrio flavus]MTI18385.1 2-hydroxychromene-2-carboxylate isomerase [Pseudovibrio flavus]